MVRRVSHFNSIASVLNTRLGLARCRCCENLVQHVVSKCKCGNEHRVTDHTAGHAYFFCIFCLI